MEDLAPFAEEEFDDSKCFHNLLQQYEGKYGAQALESLQRDLAITGQELKSKIVSTVRTDFDALARAPLEMLKLDDCVQRIEDKAHSLQNLSASSLEAINSVKSSIDNALEDYERCHSNLLRADLELQRVSWIHELGAAISRDHIRNHVESDLDVENEMVAGACLHLCALAHAVSRGSHSAIYNGGNASEVDVAAAAALAAVQEAVLPLIKDAIHRLHRVPCYVRCLCLIASKALAISTLSEVITMPLISRIFAPATTSSQSSTALMQLFVELEKEMCKLLQILQRSTLLLSGDEEIDVIVELMLSPFFERLLQSDFCVDFVQVDNVSDRYFAYMKGMEFLASCSACNQSRSARAFLQNQHATAHVVWALPLRALYQSRLSQIQSVMTSRLTGAGPTEPTSLALEIEAAAVTCHVRTSAAAAAAWAMSVVLPSVQQPPPLLPRSMQLICIILANFCNWLKSLTDDAAVAPQTSADSSSTESPSLLMMLQASADCAALAITASRLVTVHLPTLATEIIDSALAPCHVSLSVGAQQAFEATVRIATAKLSELLVSVRSISISFRQSRCLMPNVTLQPSSLTSSSRPYPTTASAYVELQQLLLHKFVDDIRKSGLSQTEQQQWLQSICDEASADWATCVDDILTTARRQNAFARKSRERAGGDAASSSATGVTDALLKMEQQVRIDVEEVCSGWATAGVAVDRLVGIAKLRSCTEQDAQ